MAVGGIYNSFHNNSSLQQIQTTYVDDAEKISRHVDGTDRSRQPDLNGPSDNLTSAAEPSQENPASRIADLDKISLKFNKKDSFEYIGIDSSLGNLDMQKAISDMQKDQVLQNYQYFVGSTGSLSGETLSEDGLVVLKP